VIELAVEMMVVESTVAEPTVVKLIVIELVERLAEIQSAESPAEKLVEAIEVARQAKVAELIEMRLVVMESAEMELAERPAEVRLAERLAEVRLAEGLAEVIEVVGLVEVVKLIEERLVVVEWVQAELVERPAEV